MLDDGAGLMILNVIAIAISIIALAASSITATQQIKLMRHANYTAFWELLSELRTAKFHKRYRFICSDLQKLDSTKGISGQSNEVQEIIYSIAFYFQHLIMLQEIGAMDKSIPLAIPMRAKQIWEAIEPFVIRERESMGPLGVTFLLTLEDYVKQTNRKPS